MARRFIKPQWLLLYAFLLILFGLVVTVVSVTRDELPTDFSDLLEYRREMRDGKNGFEVLALAPGSVFWPDDEYNEDEDDESFQLSPDELEFSSEDFDVEGAQQVVEANTALFDRVRKALKAGDFQLPKPQSFTQLGHDIQTFAKFSRVLGCRARWLFETGKHREAVDAAFDSLDLSKRYMKGQGPMLDYLVGAGTTLGSLQWLRWLAPRVDLEAGVWIAAARRLEGAPPSDAWLADALRSEFSMFINAIDTGEIGSEALADEFGWFAQFFFLPNQTCRWYGEEIRAIIDAINKPARDRAFVNFVDKFNVRSWTAWLKNAPGKMLLGMFWISFESVVLRRDLLVTAHRGTTVTLALRAYKLTHGRLPEKLDDLVPKFLTAVPKDPVDHKPLRYSAKKGFVYSIGTDATDNGGSDAETAVDAAGDESEPTFWVEAETEADDRD